MNKANQIDFLRDVVLINHEATELASYPEVENISIPSKDLDQAIKKLSASKKEGNIQSNEKLHQSKAGYEFYVSD